MTTNGNNEDAINLAELRQVLAENEQPWVAGETSMTSLPAELRNRRLGVPIPDAAELAEIDQRSAAVRSALNAGAATLTNAGLPTAFDLRNVGGANYVAGVRNQGNCGSCVAFGTIAALEGTARYGRRLPSLEVDLSEAHLYYGWGGSVGRNCDNGWMPTPALNFCINRGVTYEAEWPYTPGNTNGGSLPANWENHRAKAAGLVDHTAKVADLKNHLVNYGPVTGCFYVYADFYAYRSGVYKHVSGDFMGGHCVAIVGFDDSQQAWIIKNSWGTNWGQSGFGLIAYGECYIDTWSNPAITSVSLRTWTNASKVVGAYSTGHDNNGWVYVENSGWLHVGGAGVSHIAMFEDLLSAKEKNAFVNAYNNDGHITEAYSF